VRAALGSLLLVAAGLKGYQLATEPVLEPGLFESRWFLIAVVEFELFFGLWLLSGVFPKATWAAALACFAVFAGVSLYKALSGHATCGCFGKVPVNPWYTAALDISVVLSLARWRPTGTVPIFAAHSSPPPRRVGFAAKMGLSPLAVRTLAVAAIWLFVGVPAAVAMASHADASLSDAGEVIGDGRVVVLEPERWVGKRFPLLRYIDIGDRLSEGRWLLLLHHSDCPRCRRAVRHLGDESRRHPELRIALIEMSPYSVPAAGRGDGAGGLVAGRLIYTDWEWFARTPVVASLTDGRVDGAAGGESEANGYR
jgi:hypothetical protein